MALRLDYTNFMGDVVSGGISAADWRDAPAAFTRTHAGFLRRRQANELGFLDLPGNAALHEQSTQFAARAQGQFDDVVVLGIGGSALGPIALRTALLEPQWNALSADERRGGRGSTYSTMSIHARSRRSSTGSISSARSLSSFRNPAAPRRRWRSIW
jgi:glucose-6-phosphate isomerase